MPRRAKRSKRKRRAARRRVARAGQKPRAAAGGMAMQVRVRMYRQGLGDCFLLTFDPGGNEKHIMIDCGTLGASTTGVKLGDVAKDIHATTGGHLHVLIATHEHWDHVSGFAFQEKVFKKFRVDNVWLAWTENPEDPLAQELAHTKKDLGTALAAASRALAGAGRDPESRQVGNAVRDLLGFYDTLDPLGAKSQFKETLDAAMQFVRQRPGAEVQYFKPGDGPIEPPWLPGFRVYVLGPPYDKAALDDLGEHGSSELYHITAGLRAGAELRASGRNVDAHIRALKNAEQRADFERELPFESRFRLREGKAAIQDSHYPSYFRPAEKWRRVDGDWLRLAPDLALQLDNATNNTSLVLAIERVADGKVLLFPGDAQQGSWLSWHKAHVSWSVPSPGGPRKVTAADLLARTVLYKVGHHASHNATARKKGLEMMKQGKDLTAFVPVDRKVALGRHPKGSWRMPARPLYRRLLEKCRGRVVRSDIGWAVPPNRAKLKKTEREFRKMATSAEWAKWKKNQKKAQGAKRLQISDRYIDYFLP